MLIYNIFALIARITSENLSSASFEKDAVFRGTELILKSCCENPTISNLCAAKKIVIIGSPGAGKTTLARKLVPMLDINVYHLDRILWLRGWKAEARDTRIDILQKLVQEKQWIIEGTYIHISELHLKAADTIIFLDISPLLCSQRLIERHREYYRRSHRDIPLGSPNRLSRLRLLKVLTFPSRRDIPLESTDKLTGLRILKVLTFPFHGLRRIKQTLRSYESKQIIQLQSPKEVEDFLAQLEGFLAQ